MVAVLVASCDAYADLWRPFFTLFHRYWPDCPYRVYLGSNYRTYPDERVRALAVGEDVDWSTGFAEMVRRVEEPFVLVMLEDYLLTAPADTPRIEQLFEHMRTRDAACLRLMPVPGAPEPDAGSPDVGELLKATEYRVSLQAAIWRRDVLLELIRPGESPWDFENRGTPRAEAVDAPFLSVVGDIPFAVSGRERRRLPLPYFATAVWRGAWLRDAVALCRREGVPVDLKARPQEPFRGYVSRRLRRLRRQLRRGT